MSTVLSFALASTTANLNATYNNGTAGVGATLTDASGLFGMFGASLTDGYLIPLNGRVLVAFQSAPAQNGVYTLTTQGNGSSIPWVLTRATDYDTTGQMAYLDMISIANGNTYQSHWFVQLTSSPITVGTTAIVFSPSQGSALLPPSYVAGNLLSTSNQYSSGNNLLVDSGIHVDNSENVTMPANLTVTGDTLMTGAAALADVAFSNNQLQFYLSGDNLMIKFKDNGGTIFTKTVTIS